MKARIVYEARGTKSLTVGAPDISSEMWDGGRALVELRDDTGKRVGWVNVREAHLIHGQCEDDPGVSGGTQK